jgi:hypothetical protein
MNTNKACETCGAFSGVVKWCPPCLKARFDRLHAESRANPKPTPETTRKPCMYLRSKAINPYSTGDTSKCGCSNCRKNRAMGI